MVTSELIEYISMKQVVTTAEMVEKVSEVIGSQQENGYVYKKFIYPLLKKKYLNRVRRNIYHVTTPGNRDSIADRFIVASMIRESYYIGFHVALEFYGVAYSYRNRVYIGVRPRDRFDVFSYQNSSYVPFLTEDIENGVVRQMHLGRELFVCSKERLFIECVRYPEKVGGWEEVLKSLQGLGGIDFDVLLDYLFVSGNQALLRRVGLVLELLRGESLFYEHMDEVVLARIEDHVVGNVGYLEKERAGELNKRWMLYVSPDFRELLRGI